jgi:AmmeMemoRadiSam system protein B
MRFVILGTNHFGLAPAVVGTRKDFESASGAVPHDAAFMRRLDDRCGRDLGEFEYDHAREHSIELQVLLLRHVLGGRPLTITPYLCPDPCGPNGTAALDGRGVDLKDFALALRAELDDDATPTCIIAGADLSHVGRYFQDRRALDADVLRALEASDRRALDYLLAGDPEGMRRCVAESDNPTSICSVGCLFVLATTLQGRSRPRLLGYHQALTAEAENCVTCAAIEYAS